jgi:hypothetical protein
MTGRTRCRLNGTLGSGSSITRRAMNRSIPSSTRVRLGVRWSTLGSRCVCCIFCTTWGRFCGHALRLIPSAQVTVNRIDGYLQSRIAFYLMNLHLTPRSIYFTRVSASKMSPRSSKSGKPARACQAKLILAERIPARRVAVQRRGQDWRRRAAIKAGRAVHARVAVSHQGKDWRQAAHGASAHAHASAYVPHERSN